MIRFSKDAEEGPQFLDVLCPVLLGVTIIGGAIGLISSLSSNPEREEEGLKLLRVAKESGEMYKDFCNC